MKRTKLSLFFVCLLMGTVRAEVSVTPTAQTGSFSAAPAAVQLIQQATPQDPVDQLVTHLKQQFALIKDATKEATYASYKELLRLLDQLYAKVGELKKTVPAALIEVEKELLAAIDGLFKTNYPALIAEKKHTLPCLQELEYPEVAQTENGVMQKEKAAAAYFGRAENAQLLSAQLPAKRKEFLASPCWQKCKIVQGK